MTPVSPDVVAAIVAEAERKLKMATPVESADSTQVSGSFCHVQKQYFKVPKILDKSRSRQTLLLIPFYLLYASLIEYSILT